MDEHEDQDKIRNEEEEVVENIIEVTFRFLILDVAENVNMKNIPPSSHPTFYEKSSEDPNTILFEFGILCKIYNYLQDSQKII